MLNYETLLSNYDDKLTLMQWLKKVEEALKDASATEFKVNKKGNATLSFSIVFEDGTELESGDIVLEQGESVASAAIVNGHLELTLTNGDVLDAGDLGGVTSFSIDGSQHLIVHYQNGTTQDLGAIFSGNVNIAGTLSVTGNVTTSGGKFVGVTEFENIEDASGHKRFVEGDGVPMTSAGFTASYCKWSLSGTHLMFVLAGTFTQGSLVPDTATFATYTLPAWVYQKIYPVFASTRVSIEQAKLWGDDWTSETYPISLVMTKLGSNQIGFQNLTNDFNVSKDRSFRVQFDLLIDNN